MFVGLDDPLPGDRLVIVDSGHHHGTLPSRGNGGDRISTRTARALTAAILACALAAVCGLIMLWPTGHTPGPPGDQFLGERVEATVQNVIRTLCSYSNTSQPTQCQEVAFEITSGTRSGVVDGTEMPLGALTPTVHTGDEIVLTYASNLPPGKQYTFSDLQRGKPLLLLAALFAAAVILLGRLRGLLALTGLAVSLPVITVFVLPALLQGKDPLAVALVGAAVVGFIVLYLAHGVSIRTTIAVLGSFASLALTGLLGWLFVGAAHLTGRLGEEQSFLAAFGGNIDFQGLLLAGIVIGTLGVLDDITVTQVSAVWELHAADPTMSATRLYAAGVRIGRDHIASTVNTLLLAYAGASLPLLLLFVEANQGVGATITSETVAMEIVRTLVGSIGLVAAVPVTTYLATVVASGERPELRDAWSRAMKRRLPTTVDLDLPPTDV
jgi:uncharacterized membrane protein